jgi:hypothetical protein
MRTIVPHLLAVTLGAAGCAALARSGAGFGPETRPRRFYLTKATFPGNKVLDACARGFHMASRFEILDVSTLRYAAGIGLTSDDSGSGPPSQAAAYGSEDPSGWVRTGGSSRFTDSTDRQGSALTNCAAWSTSSPDASGTLAYLSDRFTLGDGRTAPIWNGRSERCDVPHHVWCIEDRADREIGPEGRMRRGRGRGESPDSEMRP